MTKITPCAIRHEILKQLEPGKKRFGDVLFNSATNAFGLEKQVSDEYRKATLSLAGVSVDQGGGGTKLSRFRQRFWLEVDRMVEEGVLVRSFGDDGVTKYSLAPHK